MGRNSGNPIRFSWTWNKKSHFAKVFCCFPNTGLKHCSTMCSLKLPFQVGLGSVDSVYEKKTTHFKCSLHGPHRDLLWTSQLLSEIPNNVHKRQNCRVWAHPLGTSMGLMWVCPAHTAPHLTYTCPLWTHLLEKPQSDTVREVVWRKNKKWVIINY